MQILNKFLTIFFIFVLILSGTIRFLQTKSYNTAFTYDQARDLLDIRALGEFKDLAVLGPTTSINGLRLGPFYYYVNLPAYWIGGGNPQALVYWNICLFIFSGGFIFWFFKKRNLILGFLAGLLFLTAPQMFNLTRYFWNANMATYLSVYYFLALWNFLEKKDKKSILYLGVTSSFLTQFEAAFGIVCLLFSIVVVILNKRGSWWKNFFIGSIPWFLPQILLEIKNKFQMSKLFLGVINGKNDVLGERLKFNQVFGLHFETIKKFFEGQLMVPLGWGLVILLFAIALIIVYKKYRLYGIYFVSFIIFAFLFYITIYHHPLKSWYLESLRVWYCFVIAIGLSNISKFRKLAIIIFGILLIRNIYLVVNDQRQFMVNKISDDPKNLANLMTNIDWIYDKMKGDGFEAYSYVPEVYDYPNQYLYWWYGIKKYNYMPNIVSYSLIEVPEYIRTQKKFYEKNRENKNGLIGLIYENKDLYKGWLNQFNNYCTIEKLETNWRTTLEIRGKCK